MNIDARDANVLKYFKKHGEVLFRDIPFDSADYNHLSENGLIKTKNISVSQGEGMFPQPCTLYFITPRGLYALKQHHKIVFLSHLAHILPIIIALASLVIGIIQLVR